MRCHVQVGYEAGRYFVLSSDIPGLNIETSSFEEFCEVAADVTPDLVDRSSGELTIDFHHEKSLADS